MDLALSLVNGLDEEALGMLFTTAKPALQVHHFHCQPKTYENCNFYTNYMKGIS